MTRIFALFLFFLLFDGKSWKKTLNTKNDVFVKRKVGEASVCWRIYTTTKIINFYLDSQTFTSSDVQLFSFWVFETIFIKKLCIRRRVIGTLGGRHGLVVFTLAWHPRGRQFKSPSSLSRWFPWKTGKTGSHAKGLKARRRDETNERNLNVKRTIKERKKMLCIKSLIKWFNAILWRMWSEDLFKWILSQEMLQAVTKKCCIREIFV